MSLFSDKKMLEGYYYSRSIIQFLERNDRGSRKRTSPEIRTPKRTKKNFFTTSRTLFVRTNCLVWSYVKFNKGNFFRSMCRRKTQDVYDSDNKSLRLLFYRSKMKLCFPSSDWCEITVRKNFYFLSSWQKQRKITQRKITI